MGQASTIGLDIAKRVFQALGPNAPAGASMATLVTNRAAKAMYHNLRF